MVHLLPDVAFDHDAARSAADACDETARALRTTMHERGQGAAHARRFWQGRHAEHFDDVQSGLERAAEALLDRLEATRRSIEHAADAARREQHRRDAVNRERLRAAELARQAAEREATRTSSTPTSQRGPR